MNKRNLYKSLTLILYVVLIPSIGYAQFWIGPKIGGSISSSIYDAPEFKEQYDVSPGIDWQAGFSLNYETESRFTVHSEITYERVSRKLVSKDGPSGFVIAEDSIEVFDGSLPEGSYYEVFKTLQTPVRLTSTYHFISVPLTVRVVFAGHRSAVKFYGQFGPRIRYWMAGNGRMTSSEYLEFFSAHGVDFNVKFKGIEDRTEGSIKPVGHGAEDEETGAPGVVEDPDEDDLLKPAFTSGGEYIVHKANRVQYAIDFGGGASVDLANGQRLNFDLRVSWGHSNMGFNFEPSPNSEEDIGSDDMGLSMFDDDMEYHNNMITVSAAYLFAFDIMGSKKGKSTDGTKKKKVKRRH